MPKITKYKDTYISFLAKFPELSKSVYKNSTIQGFPGFHIAMGTPHWWDWAFNHATSFECRNKHY